MSYQPNQPCPVCGRPIRPHEPVTSSFAGDPADGRNHVLIVHRGCESAIVRCATCDREFGEDESHLATIDGQGRLRSYHFGHQPVQADEPRSSP